MNTKKVLIYGGIALAVYGIVFNGFGIRDKLMQTFGTIG